MKYFVIQFPSAMLFSVFLILCFSEKTQSNGWEHAAIPLDVLIDGLDFGEPGARAQAAHSLGYRGQREAVAPLITRLKKPEPRHYVRDKIYEALGRIGDKRASPFLTYCLENEDREELRSTCASALSGLKSEAAAVALMRSLSDETSDYVRLAVVQALGEFSRLDVIELLSRLAKDGDGILNNRAIWSLGHIGGEANTKLLLDLLNKAETDIRRLHIVKALAIHAPREASSPLKKLFQTTSNSRLKSQVSIALSAISDGGLSQTFIAMLKQSDPNIQKSGIEGLVKLKDVASLGTISEFCIELDEELRELTKQSIRRHHPRILELLKLQTLAARAIGSIGAESGVSALKAMIGTFDIPIDSAIGLEVSDALYERRRTSIYASGYSKSHTIAATLDSRLGLHEPDFRLRAAAVRALGVLGFPGTSDHILPLLRDPAAEVRWTAASVLGRLGKKNIGPDLLLSLNDKVSEVRRQTSLALGYLRYAGADKALKELAEKDDSAGVRKAAKFARALVLKRTE